MADQQNCKWEARRVSNANKRGRGRQRRTWNDEVAAILKTRGISWNNCRKNIIRIGWIYTRDSEVEPRKLFCGLLSWTCVIIYSSRTATRNRKTTEDGTGCWYRSVGRFNEYNKSIIRRCQSKTLILIVNAIWRVLKSDIPHWPRNRICSRRELFTFKPAPNSEPMTT